MENQQNFEIQRIAFIQKYINIKSLSRNDFVGLLSNENKKPLIYGNTTLQKLIKPLVPEEKKRKNLTHDQKNIVLSVIYNTTHRNEYNRHLQKIYQKEILNKSMRYFSDRSIADLASI